MPNEVLFCYEKELIQPVSLRKLGKWEILKDGLTHSGFWY